MSTRPRLPNARRGRARVLGVLAALAAAWLACSSPPPEEPPPPAGSGAIDTVRAIAAEADAWLLHGRTYDEQRHSPLATIDRDNVGELGLAWSFGLESTRGIEATPIVVDGVMYVTSTWSRVFALDAVTGALRWRYDPQVPKEWGVNACCDVVNRGVAVWDGRVYVGTIDGRLIALDADTGDVVWDVKTVPDGLPYTITGAPRVVKGKVLIGNGGAELGVRGYVSAYDAATGELVWRFYTVPGDPSQPFEHPELEEAAKTWTGEWWKIGGGGTVWDSMAYDPELDLLYVGTGNGSPWTRYARSPDGGDNLFVCTILALRPDTGELVWHYQTTPGDNWDYTSVQHIVLADIDWIGGQRKVLMQAPKNGFFYVLDRETGELISADPIVDVTWASHVDLATGRPVENEALHYEDTPQLVAPATLGAHNWHPMAFNPRTGLVYIPAQRNAAWFTNDTEQVNDGAAWRIGVDIEELVQKVLDEPPVMEAFLLAWDPVRSVEAWRVPHSGYFNAGVLSTAGGLVFQGSADGTFNAYDAWTGKLLWSVDTSRGIMAAPITYRIGKKQYVAVAAGWGGGGIASGPPAGGAILDHLNEGRVFVFELGGREPIPDAPLRDKVVPEPPPQMATDDQIQQGKVLFNRHCTFCHGIVAASSHVVPDLRAMPAGSYQTFQDIVRDGALASRGMPSFADKLTAEEVDRVRDYVIDLSWDHYRAWKKEQAEQEAGSPGEEEAADS